MSTTIDSLDIQIRSNAGSAANNILELAVSLEQLKQQSGLTKITNSLSKLSKSLESIGRVRFNPSGLEGIIRMMRSLSSIQNPSGFNSALNALKKLPEAVVALNSVKLNNLGAVNQINQMVSGLSGIQKLTGLNSVINTLKKLPDVMAALDASKIEAFSAAMRKLADGLEPLATRITEVARGFAKLPSQVSKAATAVIKLDNANKKAATSTRDLGEGLDHTNINLAAGISNFQSIAGAIQRVVQVGAQFLAQAIEWDGIQYRFGRAFGEDAEEVYEHVERVNDVLGINIQQFMQYSSLYGSLLSGFGLAQKQVTAISVGLTELSYDIWAAYNDRFKTLEDASNAVRSAITGEIEPIRNAGIALTDASLQEYLDSINMAHISVGKLTEAQKAEVRYAAMVKAAMQQGIVGTYAAEMHTAEGAVRGLSQSLKTLTQAFGSLFIPILQKVIPYVTAFVELLTEAVHWIAGLFGIELFKIDWGSGGVSAGLGEIEEGAADATSGLDETAKAAKKLQDYTMGFDELNVIQPPSNSGGSGGAGGAGGIGSGDSLGLDLDNLWDDAVFAKAGQLVDDIKDKLRPFFNWMRENGDDILDIVLAIGAGFLAWKISTSFASKISDIVDMIRDKSFLGKINRIATGITLLVTGVTLSFLGGYDLGYEGVTLMNVLKTALGAALGIAGSLLVFGTGPLGWAIGIGVALTATIVGITIGSRKRRIEDEITSRFGEIELDDEMLAVYVDKITAVPKELTIRGGEKVSFDAALQMYVSEKATLDGLVETIQSTIDEIERYDFKIALGVAVGQEEYEAAIADLVADSKTYFEQNYLTLSIALSFLEGETGATLTGTLDAFYSENSVKLQELGEKLKSTVSAAFVDGEWIPEKLQEAKEIQAEIQELLEYASDVEYRAKMQGLKLETSGTELTFESFSKVLEGANEAITEKLETLEEIKMSQLQVAIMDYDANIADGMSEAEAKKIYEKTVADIEKQYRDSKIEIEYGTFDFGIDTISESFKDALADAEASGLLDFNEYLADTIAFDPGWVFDEGAGDIYGNIQSLAGQMQQAYVTDIGAIKPEVRAALAEVLEAMKPTADEYDEIAAASREAGVTVPEKVREGLSDYNELMALSGDADAINYMIGEAFSTDTVFLNTLATVEGAGEQIDDAVAEGLLNNISYVIDTTTGVVTGIENTLTGEVIRITPEMVENFEALGVDISDGLFEGADQEMKAKKKSWLDWAIWPWNWFKDKNEIDSPSKLFKRGGTYIGEGLLQGLTSSWTELKSWFNDNVAPKLTLDYWKTKFDTIRDALETKLDDAWEKVKAFFDVSEWKKKVVDAMDSIKENFKIPSLPKIKLEVTYDQNIGTVKRAIADALGLAGWPRLSWSTYATGGFPSTGEMFIARESGAEMVGSINGRTAVANNDQIVAAVSQGVYEAVRAAMGGGSNGGGQNVNVYLDGKQIYASIKKTESERGVSLMGNQLGYTF